MEVYLLYRVYLIVPILVMIFMPGIIRFKYREQKKKKELIMYAEIALEIIATVGNIAFFVWNIPYRYIPLIRDIPYAIEGEFFEEDFVVVEYDRQTPFSLVTDEVVFVFRSLETEECVEFIVLVDDDLRSLKYTEDEMHEMLPPRTKLRIQYLPNSRFAKILEEFE